MITNQPETPALPKESIQPIAAESRERAQRPIHDYAEAIVQTIPDALLVLEPDLRVRMANDAFYEIFQVQRAATEGRLIYELGNSQWDIPALRTLLEEILPENKVFIGYEVEHTFEGIGQRTMLVNGRQLDHTQLILLAITDITERKEREQQQEFLLHLSDALRAEPDADAVANRALQMLAAQMKLDRCYIAVYRLAEDRADFTHQVKNARVPPLPDGIRLSDFPEAFRVVFDRTLVIDDITETAGLSDTDRRNIAALGMRALVAATLRKGENTPHWVMVAVSVSPRRWTHGEIALIEEVSERTWGAIERTRAEEALSESERWLQQATAATGAGVFAWDIASDRLSVNPRFREMFGLPPDEAITVAALMAAAVHPDDHVPVEARIAEAVDPRSSGRYEVEHRASTPLGLRWMSATGQVYFAGEGDDRHASRLVGVILDVTERKRNELNLAFLAEVGTEFAALTSADAIIHYVGEKLAHYLGLSRCDFSVVEEEADRITTIYDWRRDADAPSVLGEHAISTFLTPLARQHYVAGELAVINDVHHDPKINAPPAMMDALHIRAVVDAPYLENGRWRFLLSVCRAEVTGWRADEVELIRELAGRIYIRLQRAHAEAALRESEARLRVMVEHLPGGAVFIVDHNLHYLLAEGEALSTAGFVPVDLIGKSLFDALSPEVAMSHEPMYRQALAGTPFLHEHESHGRTYVSRGTPLRGASGEIYGVLVVSYDITDRKEAEVALQHLNATLEQTVDARTAQVRTLASKLTMAEQEERRRVSQILHDDLQQLLYGMQMRMMAMMNDLREGNTTLLIEYAQEVYTWMSDAIQTTRRLTVDLSPPLLKGEGLADALRWLIPQMATVNGLQATLEVVEPCEIPNQGMRVLLFQIVRELLFNVVKHAGVNTATVVLQQEGGACVIKVSDAGRGFDPVAVAAKGEKGFGLFSINERLKLFGGRMTIQSAPGQGTAITVYAPVNSAAQKLVQA